MPEVEGRLICHHCGREMAREGAALEKYLVDRARIATGDDHPMPMQISVVDIEAGTFELYVRDECNQDWEPE